ncbi:MAG: hypothetical protein R3A45_08670 [Bdellovibrionota bacterium]
MWERTQLSRHPQRPYMLDYVNAFDGFERITWRSKPPDDHPYLWDHTIESV